MTSTGRSRTSNPAKSFLKDERIPIAGDSVGNVRPTYIKRVADKLVAEFPDQFTEDFESNKELLERYTNIGSKVMRNRVAGYISTMMGQKKRKHAIQPEA